MANVDPEQLAELLSAYLDDELNTSEKVLIERVLREDKSARQLLEELRLTANLVSTLPRRTAPASLAEDLRHHRERAELLGSYEEPRGGTVGGRWAVALLSVAAVLCLSVGAVMWYLHGQTDAGTSGREGTVVLVEKNREAIEEHGLGEPSARRHKRHGGDASKKGHPSPPPAVGISQFAGADLLATADIDRKLLTATDVARLREHPFANETVRLQVMVRDVAQGNAVGSKLIAALVREHIVDLSAQRGSTPARALTSRGFYYRGKPGVNFEEADQNQILVHLSSRQLGSLLDELANVPGGTKRVALLSGPATVPGLRASRRALVPTETRPQPATPFDPGAADQLGVGETGWHSDVARLVGLDPAMLKMPLASGSPDSPTAATVTESEEAMEQGMVNGERSTGPAEPKGAKEALAKLETVAEEKTVVEEPPSLVKRRLKELGRARRARGTGEEPGTRGDPSSAAISGRREPPVLGYVSADTPAERYVTLVVQLVVAKPEPPKPARHRSKPASKETPTRNAGPPQTAVPINP